jgi:hypothetical protein
MGNREEWYYGLRRIAKRLNCGLDTARRLCQKGIIRAYKEKGGGVKSPWYAIESEIAEDIKKIPKLF